MHRLHPLMQMDLQHPHQLAESISTRIDPFAPYLPLGSLNIIWQQGAVLICGFILLLIIAGYSNNEKRRLGISHLGFLGDGSEPESTDLTSNPQTTSSTSSTSSKVSSKLSGTWEIVQPLLLAAISLYIFATLVLAVFNLLTLGLS